MSANRPLQRLAARHATSVILSLALLATVLLLTGLASPLVVRVGIGTLISVVLVVGLFIFVGNSGILSFGHLGFATVSAYATAWLTMRPAMKKMLLPGLPEFILSAQWPSFLATLASGLLAGLVALASGVFIMRLSGVAASIATLALLAIVNTVYANSDAVTGGVGSLAGIPTGLGIWTVLGWAVFAIVVAHIHATSAAGLALKSCREDPIAAEACGIRGFRVRLLAYVLSGFVCGIAGNLQARYLGVISPDSFYFGATLLALAMLIVGGMFSLTGAVAGVVAISVAMEVLIRLEGSIELFGFTVSIPAGTANFLIAAAMCVALVKRPQGLVGDREITLPASLLGKLDRHASNSKNNVGTTTVENTL
ncbi:MULTISPECIES: branched-chain amino acid ABC transporter permease [unclassified Mesorhizobium]|uniref:branched-chain amino acid ABC transporter permease n=1 Tax=unclassified Mesorhizobium TaxID=325217 RepID=UPI0015E395CB|nr:MULTISPECIES: branched-chain amino acid ABC transporter permease [unclassified Mesorhizobium]